MLNKLSQHADLLIDLHPCIRQVRLMPHSDSWRRNKLNLDSMTDEQLLDMRMCDLKLIHRRHAVGEAN